jgi:hypothetical protein
MNEDLQFQQEWFSVESGCVILSGQVVSHR